MNVLLDELPRTVTVSGERIPINTDYRTGILFEQTVNDLLTPDDEKLRTILTLYYGGNIFPLLAGMDTVQEALDGVMWFYRCGADKTPAEERDEESGPDRETPFSYEHDAPYIYAAFMEAYGIDLAEKRLHWWQFRALFLGLPETVLFSRIMAYRAMEIPARMPKEKKRFYQRMKRLYKLPEPPGRENLKKEMEAILAKGGDISHLL